MPDKTENSKRKRHLTFGGIALVFLLVCGVGMSAVTLSRYILSSRKGTVAEAAGFRFSSDYLTGTNPSYDVYDGARGFKIKLYSSENGVASTTSVNYTVTVTGGSATQSRGTIAGGAAELTITPNGGKDSVVTVRVDTTPYKKSVSAVFTMKDAGESSAYSFTDSGYFSTLKLMTGAAPPADVTINYPLGFAPDGTSRLTASWRINTQEGATQSTGTLSNLKPNSEYILTFFDTGNTPHAAASGTFTDSITIS